ncbi:hypothetical protein LOK49_LG06G03072 [Camellia lanceoleosa]|uniref:Uncharacterized protein n=1 Tax=Camellia lanceoleosa TaxID=1840588 RepID=A0ACC0HBF8_9ERIC|nr:hypothetical protein LOK49_LG06G03072 [Camellia lanceoleosa]
MPTTTNHLSSLCHPLSTTPPTASSPLTLLFRLSPLSRYICLGLKALPFSDALKLLSYLKDWAFILDKIWNWSRDEDMELFP